MLSSLPSMSSLCYQMASPWNIHISNITQIKWVTFRSVCVCVSN